MDNKLELKSMKWEDVESLPEKDRLKMRNYLLNKQPPKGWLKKHPLYKNSYLPIDKVEFLLTLMFGKWRVEVLQTYQIANSVCVNVRLHYLSPDSNTFDWQDGVGAAAMQVNSGKNAMDQSQIKSNAVMLALPIAETNAVKDAADKIGCIFGRDLNRKDLVGYDAVVKDFKNAQITEK